MSRKKIILLATGLIAAGVGVILAVALPSGHEDHSSGAGSAVIFASLVPVFAASVGQRRRKGCAKEEKNG